MSKKVNINKKKTVLKSLKAPSKLANRPSGNNHTQTYRSSFMRDRDRILYSKAFRRLSGKTQVFLYGNDDHKRTRLTHTLEVAQIAKTIANSLKLDLDLTEAIALGHDIGHTPFGHAGERTLHEIMTPCNENNSLIPDSPFINIGNSTAYDNYLGFKHNLQSVNVSLNLEKDYDDYGLDLTNFTLYGMNMHSSTTYKKGKNPEKLGYYNEFNSFMRLKGSDKMAWSFEAFVVKEADEIAQRHHDLEDAIRGNLIPKEEVIKKIKTLFKDFLSPNDKRLLKTMQNTHDSEIYISLLSRLIVNLFVTQITKCSIYNMNNFITKYELNEKNFRKYMLDNNEDEAKSIIAYDKFDSVQTFQASMDQFEKYVSTRVLSSYDIQTTDAHGQYIIKKIFQSYYKTPAQLPDHCVIEFLKTKIQPYSNEKIQKIINENGMETMKKSL